MTRVVDVGDDQPVSTLDHADGPLPQVGIVP
jgi:hypothetical protein